MKKKLCILITAVLMLMMLFTGCGKKTESKVGIEPGETMPDFTVELCDGSTASLSDLLDDYDLVVLNIFASWCKPCENEFPDMERVYEANSDDMIILSISAEPNDTQQIIADYKESHGLTFLMGLKEDNLPTITAPGFPTTIFIDGDGQVGFIKMGSFVQEGDFEAKVNYFLSPDYNGQPLKSEMALNITGILSVVLLITLVTNVVGRWIIFRKAGKHGWFSLIPFLAEYKEFSLCWKGWIGIVAVCSGFSYFVVNVLVSNEVLTYGIFSNILRFGVLLACFALWFVQSLKLAKAFGKGTGAGVLVFFTGGIGRVVLGLVKTSYQGR